MSEWNVGCEGKGYNGHVIRRLRQKLWSMYLYPEIGSERTLGKVILEFIALSGREITLSDASKDAFSARLCKDRRIAEVWASDDERVFVSHFSMRGVRLAYHVARDLHEVARAVESWLMDELSLREMKQEFPNLDVSELAFETEAGRGITAHWNHLLVSLDSYSEEIPDGWFEPEFCALIRAAANRPLLQQLVPKVSLGCVLLFSRTLGYPYAMAGNCGIFAAGGQCIVQTRDGKQLAEGRLEDMLDVFERRLPSDIGPAIFGTADDLVG